MDEKQDLDVQDLSDEELAELSGGIGPKYCPIGTIKMCDTVNGIRTCWCEPIPGYKNPFYDS